MEIPIVTGAKRDFRFWYCAYGKGMDWAQRTVKRPGALKKALGCKGQDIPPNTLAKAARAPARVGKGLATTLRTFK
jgi:hypothetical protein